jgi:hypothetical protein
MESYLHSLYVLMAWCLGVRILQLYVFDGGECPSSIRVNLSCMCRVPKNLYVGHVKCPSRSSTLINTRDGAEATRGILPNYVKWWSVFGRTLVPVGISN